MQNQDKPKVDFIGIGTRRGASSWIFRCLEDHPEVNTSYIKEVLFFNDDSSYEKGIKEYRRCFQNCSPDKICGEFTPDYLGESEKCATRIKKHYPDVKLIATVRNPLDSLYSTFVFRKYRGKYNYKTFEEFIESEPSAVDERNYFKHLSDFLKHFDRKKMLILVYEDIEKDPVAFMRKIYQFLNVDSDFVSQRAQQRINAGRDYKVFIISRIMYKIMGLLKKFSLGKKIVLAVFYSKLKIIIDKMNELNKEQTTKETERPPMNAETKKYLLNCYKQDIQQLENMLNRDLSIWK